jgi:hypothetical protein
MRGKYLLSAVALNDYMVLSTSRDADKAQDFVSTMQRVGPAMGIQVNRRCNMITLDNDRTENFTRNIRNNLTERTQMVSSL